ncbi:MAG: R3H domain-containing nucleic acid-binding protein [Pseudanabaena sp.]|jgi:stage III sporulation protein SpoIIIAA|uniref:R3H domain-containing nucleic acid-binding protein n=1 Tax=Pseudanabaena mucicola TaxID=71190 RepID=UPI0025788E6C|nr:R3H domain-containing nucleic acid-binding protein [Pseudanabaena mucicola]MCA6574978.1 AAA family ATPase [Pseudanabaena sp. M53BS1SP1A06MG]MCA6582086.1 AAA family ATPase [Pseudanabaena sp. M34BS1SP1A06MG]MCA6586891.1 AAA family ATPase [Pseudanabaena sp. M051S1SP1A06QC]MCA6590032.1 AAA family ATPase [Pseudanabaena sp. M109S1SP1A06QC]MCA6592195.1 AAA family ATPase [Pseudanabaena sp. M38BS1SP1A06MG]MCA6596368.1 AAA family ATPase [Pseudanabaena sp. M046S1SP1A06QC]MCA6599757.1 AAA family ATPa
MDSIRKQVTDNLEQLLDILPPRIKNSLELCGGLEQLVEIVMDLGRLPEARYFDSTKYLTDDPITKEDLAICVKQVGEFGGDNRAGIERTLHRISAIRNRKGEIIGLTCRVGRAVYGTIAMIRDLVETGKSILLLGKPGMGKTTALREIARVLADDLNKRVVIIDSSNEIAGDGDIPHPAIGRARRMQVSQPELQHQVMIEAVENHMPEVIVIDEIGTELEALAARTIAERGVQLVGTAHGNQLANLIKNPTLSDLIGGIQSVTLGDEEMRRRGLPQKSILERKAQPTFDIAVEMWERYRWAVHSDVAATIDMLLRDRDPGRQIRSVNDAGEVTTTDEKPKNPEIVKNPVIKGWRASGRMKPIPLDPQVQNRSEIADLTSKLNSNPPSDNINEEEEEANELANVYGAMQERFGTLYVYLYGVSRHQTEQVIQSINLPIEITKDLDEADIVLALRSQIRTSSKVRQVAEARQIPIHAIKTSTLPQINRALRRILHIDESPADTITDLNMFAYGDSEDEIEALEETRLAVEQIVIPKGQPVELLPRSSIIRRMQHELVEHYQLRSESYGSEPNRRLRIFPNS